MNANHLTALRAGPPFLFVSNQMSDTRFLYGSEIVEHAHPILIPVAFIQLFEPGAGKVAATAAVFVFPCDELIANLNFAGNAVGRFQVVVTSTTGACFLVSNVCSA